ncbi:unnamed protein product [Sphagnum troendelagicum]|uniref:Uncharacterized protein n=1 Tax=Sphagnum troendelagicum TaxID=128251 RepID=A0ABP0TYJ2_9BRYO
MAKADPARFWRRYCAQKEAVHDIGREALRQGFATLLGPPSSPPDPVIPAPASDVDGCTLSQNIQLCEIADAMKRKAFDTVPHEKLWRVLEGIAHRCASR